MKSSSQFIIEPIKKGISMTFQHTAFLILKEKQRPLSATRIATIAFRRGLVKSWAEDPINSFIQTIEKNIRDSIYNNPELIFVYKNKERLIGLPTKNNTENQKINITISLNRYQKELVTIIKKVFKNESDNELYSYFVLTGMDTVKTDLINILTKVMKKG